MTNLNRFLLSISVCLVIAMAHASSDDQALESRIVQKLQARQKELQDDIAEALKYLAQTPEEREKMLLAQVPDLDRSQLDQLKDPVANRAAMADIKLRLAEGKAALTSANTRIALLTTKQPATQYTQLKELLEKREKLETEIKEQKQKQEFDEQDFDNLLEKRTELDAVNEQIMQLTTPPAVMAELQAAEEERKEAWKPLWPKIEEALKEAFEKMERESLQQVRVQIL